MRNSATGDRLIAVFLLGLLLLTPPLMAIFNVDRLLFGIPLLYLYLFGAWILLVVLVWAVLRPRRSGAMDPPPTAGG